MRSHSMQQTRPALTMSYGRPCAFSMSSNAQSDIVTGMDTILLVSIFVFVCASLLLGAVILQLVIVLLGVLIVRTHPTTKERPHHR